MTTKPMTVGDVMTRAVISVSPTATFRQLVDLMAQHQVSGVPVVDAQKRPIGIVSEDDLLARERAQTALIGGPWHPGRREEERARSHACNAGELMSAPPSTISSDQPLPVAARQMHRRGVRRLVVVDGDGRLAGILSRRDLLAVYRTDDAKIRRRVLAGIRPRLAWNGRDGVEVTVHDGVVKLTGDVEYRSDIVALRAIAANIDGVVDVRDDLNCAIEDISIGSHLDDLRATVSSGAI